MPIQTGASGNCNSCRALAEKQRLMAIEHKAITFSLKDKATKAAWKRYIKAQRENNKVYAEFNRVLEQQRRKYIRKLSK
jgi:hypothetical protein